jgi:type IV pilus assembly protein PilC
VILATRTEVEGGASLADAMRRHPKAFDTLYVNMVAAGEAGGILDTILKRLAVYIEKNVKLQGQVKAAMIYPAAVMTIAGLVVAVILWKVIPTFAELFAGLGAELPLPTRVVIWASNSFVKALPFMVVGVIGSVFGLRAFYATYGGRRTIDNIMLKMPILGMILRKIAVARFCRTLSTLMASGVPILDGLEITAKTAGNRVIQDAIMESRASIAGGETISAPLQKSAVFPPMVISMIAVGEQTGGLDEMLSKIADFYDEEVDAAVSGLLSLMEPIMIVFLGVVVGGMVVAMYLPIFDMINAVQ